MVVYRNPFCSGTVPLKLQISVSKKPVKFRRGSANSISSPHGRGSSSITISQGGNFCHFQAAAPFLLGEVSIHIADSSGSPNTRKLSSSTWSKSFVSKGLGNIGFEIFMYICIHWWKNYPYSPWSKDKTWLRWGREFIISLLTLKVVRLFLAILFLLLFPWLFML